jgi:hypothetical protein
MRKHATWSVISVASHVLVSISPNFNYFHVTFCRLSRKIVALRTTKVGGDRGMEGEARNSPSGSCANTCATCSTLRKKVLKA